MLFCLLLMAAACGPSQGQSQTSPAATTSTPAATASTPSAFAALEAKGSANPDQWNTVAIVGFDGNVKATTTFIPMSVPDVGCMGAILHPSAQVAGDKVYFADGKGVVRTLSAQGVITQVASFPLATNQQMLSFAVSPDGSRLLGAVLTVPGKFFACSGGPPPSGLQLDVFSAQAGGASTLLYHEIPADTNVMALTGWDAVGPIGTSPTVWASQGGGPMSQLGVAVRIDANTGKVLRQVSDPNSCRVWDTGSGGDFTCVPDGTSNVSVRRPDGSEIWHAAGSPNGSGYLLAPDEKHVTAVGDAGLQVLGRDGTTVTLAGGHFFEGWLYSATLIGAVSGNSGAGNLSSVALSTPGTWVDLGLTGKFLGVLGG